jgi:hypothetical protein
MKHRILCFIIPLLLLLLIPNLNGKGSATNTDNVIFPTNSSLHGVPYKEWLVKWWVWRSGIPQDMHPEEKYPDVKRCSAMQDGPVWFMPVVSPGKGEVNYKCEIPLGKDIMLLLSPTSCDIGVEGYLSDQGLQGCADNIRTPLNNIEVSVDGKKVNVDQLGKPILTDFFNVTYPTNPLTVWGPIKPGTYRAMAEGLFLFLHGLAPGKHIVETNVADILKGKDLPEPPAIGTFEILVH